MWPVEEVGARVDASDIVSDIIAEADASIRPPDAMTAYTRLPAR